MLKITAFLKVVLSGLASKTTILQIIFYRTKENNIKKQVLARKKGTVSASALLILLSEE